jgi:hypothetical protein
VGEPVEGAADFEGSAFDFVRREEVSEKIDPSLDAKTPSVPMTDWTQVFGIGARAVVRAVPKIANAYVYDYPCIRSGRQIREIRALLSENGKKKSEPDAKLKTAVFVYGSVLLSPVGVRFQPEYDYTILGKDKVGKTPVVIIDAKPKSGALETTNLFGQVWVDPKTVDVLRIEWDESRVRHHEFVEKLGEKFGRKPRLTIRSEFSAEKNGIRFPTRLYIQEAYLNERGRAFVRSETNVVYKDFKFFTGEVEVR